ncbi:MAG TPA: hypothetical protein VE263_01045 [Candidatus Angelobacter sp.]|nr:hypothetical protein [Candidatus Angelobacter sp.]
MIRSKTASHATACVTRMTFLWALFALALHVLPGTIAPAHAQGTRKDDIVFNSRGIPLAGATVRVCAMPASGQPCTPLALIYSDAALTQALANPTTTDGLGNYFFYAAPGKYEIEISGPQITTKQIPNVILPNDPASPTFSAVSAFSLTLSGNLTVNGNTTVVGNLASGTLNVTNQSTPPGTPASGTVNLYTKTADKRLYYKDDTGTETGPLGAGAQTNITNTFTAGQNFDGDTHFKGLNPWIDVVRFGARPVNPNITPAAVGITATTTSGQPTVTISSASTFQNGDGVVIYGAGPTQSMTTPSAPTVTASLPTAAGGVGGLGYTVAGPTGATTYNYQIVARDKNGGLTAASTVGSTSTGAASLGTQSVAITSLSRASSGVVTVVTSAAHGLSVGAMVHVAGTSIPNDFDGWFVVGTVPDNTHFTFTNGITTVESATGGTVYWWNANHLSWSAVTGAWEYYIYGRTGGSLTLIGVSKPNNNISGNNFTDTTWDDYGSPMMDGVALPPYVPNTPPGAATSDYLSTTILSGAGTTTLTLNANAGTSVSGATIRYDAAPNILAAAAAANGSTPLYFPASSVASGTYVVNSYLDLSGKTLAISQVGALTLNETMALGVNSRWYGDRIPPAAGAIQFGFQPNTTVSVVTANPGVYVTNGGSSLYQGLLLSSATNAAQLMVIEGGNQITFNDMAFAAGAGNNDYMTIGLNIRSCGIGCNGFGIYLNRVELLGGSQGNLTPAPMMICDRCGQTQVYSYQSSGRGLFFTVQETGGQTFNMDEGYEQGGQTPFLMTANRGGLGGYYILKHVNLDTMANPMFAWVGPITQSPILWLLQNGAPSSGVGLISGSPLSSIVADGATSGQNTNVTVLSGASVTAASTTTGQFMKQGIQVSGALGVGYAIARPAAPTVVLGGSGSCSSNCVAAGTYYYYVIANDANGGFSLQSPASAPVTTDGTQTITVSWVPVNGQVTTNRCRYTTAQAGLCLAQPGGGVTGTSYVDVGGNVYTVSAVSPATGLAEGLSAQGFAGHQALLVDPNSAFSTTLKPATLTANRTQTLPDATGFLLITSYVNSAYDNATRANGAIGSNWTVTNNGINIASNNFVGTAATNDVAYWNANSFSSVQFSQVTLTALNGTTDFPGVAVLLSGTGASTHGYNCVEDTTNIFIQRIAGTSNTTLTSAATTGAAGDILRLEVDPAGNLTCYKDGVSTLTANDTTYTSGAPGLFLFGTVATAKNWSGGNLHPLAQLDSEQDWTKTQHFTQGIALGGAPSESFNNNPRAEQNVFLPGALTSTWTGAIWTTDKPVAITRVQVQAKTAPSGCTTNAIVRLTDGATPVNVTISAAANDSGAISQNYAAGSSLTVAVQTAAAGCTTSPADANVTVQYRMQ